MTNVLMNYGLVSDQNPHWLYFLKSPSLISNPLIYFDQSVQHQSVNDLGLQPKTYYQFTYFYVDKKKNKIKITQAKLLATIGGEWKSETFLNHLKQFQGTLKRPQPGNKFMKEEMESGQLRVNDQGWIYVKSTQSGYRKKLKLVNNPYAIPLLKGCKVDFFLRKYAENEGPKVKISGLHFKSVTLAGILKIINDRIFFEPRHTDYQRMIPLEIPEKISQVIEEHLPETKGSLPYNMFKRYKGDHQILNRNLAKFVLQGRFLDWPLKFSHPVITIEAIQEMNCNNLKKATLYELGIPFLDYDEKEHLLCKEIINNFTPELITGRLRIIERCYSFDCEGGSCYDDAFSFNTTTTGYRVSIHISDVPSLVSSQPYLLQRARCRDQTIYIKNYYRSMFPEELKGIMSLVENRLRLTVTLTFQINKEGEIDYSTVQLRETIIKVVQNITHGDIIRDPQDRITLSGLASALGKCPLVQKLVVFQEIETAVITAQLLHLSAHLPMIVYHNNLKQVPHITKITKESTISLYKKAVKKVRSFEAEKLSRIEKEVLKQHKNEIEEIIIKATSQKHDHQTSLKSNPMQTITIDIPTENSELSISSESSSFSNQEEDLCEIKKKNEFQSTRPTGIKKNEFFRKVSSKEGSAAECFRFLDKLFRAADFNVDFSHPKNIQLAFRECQKKYKDKIALLYFRTKLIMSKQHFESIAKLTSEGKLKDFEFYNNNSGSKYQNSGEKKENAFTFSENKAKEEEQKLTPEQYKTEQLKEKRQIMKQDQVFQEYPQKVNLIEQKDEKSLFKPKDQTQHELSVLINVFTCLLENELEGLCEATKEQVEQVVCKLQLAAEEKKIKVIERNKEDRVRFFNQQIRMHIDAPVDIDIAEIKPLKWNTPIRSGSSLHAQSLLKNYSWIFQGKVQPSTAITNSKEISIVENHISQILKERSRHESMELNGRMKTACRQLDKIDFLFLLRQQPDRIWDFLTITSPSQRVQFVYHEFIEEVEVENPQEEFAFYSRVKGKFTGTFDFPIKLKVVLEEK